MNELFIRRTAAALFNTPIGGTRFILGLAELIWAFSLFWPGDTFNRETYYIMSEIFGESTWATLFLFSGSTQIWLVINNHMDDHWFSRVFSLWNSIFWCIVVASIYLSISPPPAAISGETALAIGSLWIWLRPLIIAIGEKNAREAIDCNYTTT